MHLTIYSWSKSAPSCFSLKSSWNIFLINIYSKPLNNPDILMVGTLSHAQKIIKIIKALYVS